MRRIASSLFTLAAAALIAAPALAANEVPERSTDSTMNSTDDGQDANTGMDDPMDRDMDAENADRDSTMSAAAEGEYVVKQGDTLAEIAKDELGSADEWKQIASANGIDDPEKLRVGQKLKIPAKSGTDDSFKSSMR
jgi:nucleoid-associated protein YgaU